MPIAPTYPGVYIEEIPSGVRTITGVATSITAFIGRARRGPTNDPVLINSFGDFERAFGGVQEEYLMSYAVRDFYLNGGKQALIVRLVHPNFATDAQRDEVIKVGNAAKSVANATIGNDVATAKKGADDANTLIRDDQTKTKAEKDAAKGVAKAVDDAAIPGATVADLQKAAKGALPEEIPAKARITLPTDSAQPPQSTPLVLEVADEGDWGNNVRTRVDYSGLDQVGDRYQPLTEDDLFNLTIGNTATGVTEHFLSVSLKEGPRRVDRVLQSGSNLVRVNGVFSQLPRPVETDAAMDAKIDKQIDNDAAIPPDKKEQAKKDAKKTARQVQPFSAKDQTRSVGGEEGADGGTLDENDITAGEGLQDNKRGLFALDKADLFNLLCIPPDVRAEDEDAAVASSRNTVYGSALRYCVDRRAMLIVDSPASWSTNKETAATDAKNGLRDLNLNGEAARNAAIFFPRVIEADPRRDGQPDTFVPCGIVAGVMARTDVTRGVWKAPAGLDATLSGVNALEVNLNDDENGVLNPLGINCLRFFPVAGRVVWGSRTLRGADQLADEYKYIPVRRLALYIEESLFRGTQWVVFEPNDEPLWAQIRLNVGAFMNNLFRQGAFQGQTPKDAYFVKCDKETTIQNDINLGIVNIIVGFAPLKPAEFVIIKLQQMAGQIQT